MFAGVRFLGLIKNKKKVPCGIYGVIGDGVLFYHVFFIVVSLQIISYDSARGGVTVVTEKGETTTSFLLIQKARPSDSGQYQCNPSNAQPKSITVHVLNGTNEKKPNRRKNPLRKVMTYCLIKIYGPTKSGER